MAELYLHRQHEALGAKWTSFADVTMPLTYQEGAKAEHVFVRQKAGLFDISHMGQFWLIGEQVADFLHHLCPSDMKSCPESKGCYTLILNQEGGILDDVIITHTEADRWHLVCNASRYSVIRQWLDIQCPASMRIVPIEDRGLLALQGPESFSVLEAITGFDASTMPSMSQQIVSYQGQELLVGTMGYTGEVGVEISVPLTVMASFWDALIAHPDVKPCGLSARDSLRLEMGFPLYGSDIDEKTNPIEAALSWVIRKDDLPFIGKVALTRAIEEGIRVKRCGIRLEGRGMLRPGYTLWDDQGNQVGSLTSGGFSPSLECAIGMAYLPISLSAKDTKLWVEIRGKKMQVAATALKQYKHSKKEG